MEENSKSSGRRTKIDKEQVLTLLNKIGIFKLPKCSRNLRSKIKPKDCVKQPYLTCGRSVNKDVARHLEDKTRLAYRPTQDLLIVNDKPRLRSYYRSLHTYRSRLDNYKLERLFVPEEKGLPGRSITEDIDPEYYTIVAGRPIKELENLEEHKWAVRNCFLTRMQVKWLEEEQLKIRKRQKEEEEELKAVEEELQRQVEGFNKFLEEDFISSADLLAQAEEATAKSQKLENELGSLSKELECTKTRVTLLKEEWANCQMLQHFLYSVAPLQWRRLHDYIHKKVTPFDAEGPSSGRSRMPSLTIKSEMSSIAHFIGDSRSCNAPALYFDNPDQLFAIFNDLEESNLDALLQCERIQPAVLTMDKANAEAANIFDQERSALEEDVEDLRRQVEMEEARAKKLESETNQIIHDHLHNLLTDPKTIKLTACLEDAYERVVGPNDRNLDIVQMMKALETTHERLRLQLDVLPAELVIEVTNAWESEHRRIMGEAREAAKKVHQMDMLVKRFSKALKPWTARRTRRLVNRSTPPPERIKKVKPPQGLTSAELDDQYFFGDNTDDDSERKYRPLC